MNSGLALYQLVQLPYVEDFYAEVVDAGTVLQKVYRSERRLRGKVK